MLSCARDRTTFTLCDYIVRIKTIYFCISNWGLFSAEYQITSTQMVHSPLDLARPKLNVDPPTLLSPLLCPQPRLLAPPLAQKPRPETSKFRFFPLPLPSESIPAANLVKSALKQL